MLKPSSGIGGEILQKLVKQGKGTPTIHARIDWTNAESFRKYVVDIAGQVSVHPSFLPTQATGRWRVTEPPIINFPDPAKAEKKELPDIRGCFIPWPGTYWLCFDWQALHGRFMAMASNDEMDMQAFRDGLDIHTMTTCQVFHYPLPSNLVDPHGSLEDADWRAKLKWLGSGDRRRHAMKTVRYTLYNAYDEKGVLESQGLEELGISMNEILKYARLYLKAKSNMVDYKKTYCDDAIEKRIARSVYGRRRVLRGSDYKTLFKAAISHWLQGTEVDMLEQTMVECTQLFPECWMAYPSHDGLKLAFPESIPKQVALAGCKPIVERERTINGNTLPMTASWEFVNPDGSHEKA